MFSLKKICQSIYLLEFDSHVELISHFMRFQEIYESPNKNFRNKPFELMDYIKWYTSNSEEQNFTYFSDWGGFNIPLFIIKDFYHQISDKNSYDHFMKSISDFIYKQNDPKPYLIGTKSGEFKTIEHEIAHGLYYSDSSYKDSVDNIIKLIPSDKIGRMALVLQELGYTKEVFYDEIQAFSSTGLTPSMSGIFSKKEVDYFKENLKLYFKKKKIKLS